MAGEAPTTSATSPVSDIDPLTDARWTAFLDRRDESVVYHHPAWLRVLSGEYGRPVLGLAAQRAGGELCGVLPLMWTRGIPVVPAAVAGPRLASLPRTPVAGAVAEDESVAAALYREAARRARAHAGARLQVKPAAAGGAEALAAHPWRETFVVDLPDDAAALRFGSARNHARIRWAVNKAVRSGVTVRLGASEADVRRWYPLHLEALRAHAVPPRPLRLFVAMWQEMAPAGMMRLYLAEDGDGELLAGTVVLAHGATAFYAFNGVRRDALSLRPNELLQWQAIHDAVRDGRRRYDLGEVVEHHAGLAEFKRKWGARPVRLVRLYDPAPQEPPDPGDAGSALRRGLERAWQRLPLRATALLGDVGYRFL